MSLCFCVYRFDRILHETECCFKFNLQKYQAIWRSLTNSQLFKYFHSLFSLCLFFNPCNSQCAYFFRDIFAHIKIILNQITIEIIVIVAIFSFGIWYLCAFDWIELLLVSWLSTPSTMISTYKSRPECNIATKTKQTKLTMKYEMRFAPPIRWILDKLK